VFVIQMLFSIHLAFAATEMPVQQEVDRAFDLILRTQIGKSICRDILGADAQALELHLGISRDKAETIANDCQGSEASEWIYPTSPSDIRKLSIKAAKPRRYRLVFSDENFPIESWTDAISNVTTILTHSKSVTFSRMVQILAHETAVSQDIPHLRGLNLKTDGMMDPLVAISNPLQGHTLTYLRALQVEFSILTELVDKGQIAKPADLSDPYLQYLVSERCMQTCIFELIENTRAIYKAFTLPLLAFSPHYRALALQELPRMKVDWDQSQWTIAQQVLNILPVEFMKNQYNGDVVGDLSRFFYRDQSQSDTYQTVDAFFIHALWPLESKSLAKSRFSSGITLLEFMKRPLLSGYNISLSSGPRVRVRTGNIE